MGRILGEEANAPLHAHVSMCDGTAPERELAATDTDHQGRFVLQVAPMIRCLRAAAGEHASVRRRVERRTTGDAAARTMDLGDVILPVGTQIAGRVVDAQAHPVSGATLFLAQGEMADTARHVGQTLPGGVFALDERIAPDDFRRDNELGIRAILIAVADAGVGWSSSIPRGGAARAPTCW